MSKTLPLKLAGRILSELSQLHLWPCVCQALNKYVWRVAEVRMGGMVLGGDEIAAALGGQVEASSHGQSSP